MSQSSKPQEIHKKPSPFAESDQETGSELQSDGSANTSGVDSTDPGQTLDSDNTVVQEEIGGRPGPDPTRYGDWEKNGRCIDF